jgi:acylphosphatase
MKPMAEELKNRMHATVRGRVQGVSFRYFVVEQAENLNLYGWVRNKWDGSVEVTAEGKRQDLETLLQAIREGPPMARVTDVDFEWQAFTGEYGGFQVRSTV